MQNWVAQVDLTEKLEKEIDKAKKKVKRKIRKYLWTKKRRTKR